MFRRDVRHLHSDDVQYGWWKDATAAGCAAMPNKQQHETKPHGGYQHELPFPFLRAPQEYGNSIFVWTIYRLLVYFPPAGSLSFPSPWRLSRKFSLCFVAKRMQLESG